MRRGRTLLAALSLAALGAITTAVVHPIRATDPPLPTPQMLYPHPAAASGATFLFTAQAGNKYGFEGGKAVKVGGTYYLFTTELTSDPFWVKTTLALWTSPDSWTWKRYGSLMPTSSADQSGTDRRAALWSPMPVQGPDGFWRIYYVSYRSTPATANYDGEIWESISTVPGNPGIVGPYRDLGVVLSEQDGGKQAWEGAQGDDSFSTPYQVGPTWYALYGSCCGTGQQWQLGLVSAPSVDGPWTRLASNPLTFSTVAENPVVERVQGYWLALYDDVSTGINLGCMFSTDGTTWANCANQISSGVIRGVRTPLSLIEEWDGSFTVLYTAGVNGRTDDVYKVWVG